MFEGRIIYFVASSVDGFIARRDGSIDWLFHDQDYGFSEFFENIKTVVQGRKTYEQVLTFGEYPYKSKENFVFSRTLTSCEHAELIDTSVAEFAETQRQRSGGDIWVVGGGALASAFLSAGVVDEVSVFVHPILLGDGLPLSPSLQHDVRLMLTDSNVFDTGLVELKYQVVDGSTCEKS